MKEIINTHIREDGVLEIYRGNRLFVEIKDGKNDEDFIKDVLYGMGYHWREDGTIFPIVTYPTKEDIYDIMCQLLTDYEHKEEESNDIDWEAELYDMLVRIQRHWEDIITVQND